MDEGGIGGIVGLYIVKLFDYDGFKGVISVQVGQNLNIDDISLCIVVLVLNIWDMFGVFFFIVYSNWDISE